MSLDVRLESLVEMSLSANLRKATVEQQRLKWLVENDTAALENSLDEGLRTRRAPGNFLVTLKPREIRTFLVNAQPLDPAL